MNVDKATEHPTVKSTGICPGGHSAHTHTGGQSKKFSGNPKIPLQHNCDPKISAHFILKNLYMNIKYRETMQTKVRIASSEPRNIILTMCGVKKYHEDGFSFILTQKYHFWQYSPKNVGLSSPYVHLLSAPPGGICMRKILEFLSCL